MQKQIIKQSECNDTRLFLFLVFHLSLTQPQPQQNDESAREEKRREKEAIVLTCLCHACASLCVYVCMCVSAGLLLDCLDSESRDEGSRRRVAAIPIPISGEDSRRHAVRDARDASV